MHSRGNEVLYRLTQEFEDGNPRIKCGSNLLNLMVTAAIAVALSSCTAAQTKVAALNSTSTEFGYPNPVPQSPAKKTASSSKVISRTVVTATYLGRAPYICTPSGFGRKPSCFTRSFTKAPA
jgi:hypothetical protein